MVDISNKIKELRTGHKMTQSEFASRLGVTKSAISSYENGSRLPSYDILLKMARVFKVSTDLLLGHTDENNLSLDVTGLKNEQIMLLQELVENYRKVNAMTPLVETMAPEYKYRVQKFIDTGKDMK